MVALRTLAENRVEVELLSPDQDFYYRPLAVAEPFGRGEALRFGLLALVTGCGARHRLGSLVSVNRRAPGNHTPGRIASVRLAPARDGRSPPDRSPGALTYRGSEDTRAFARILEEARSREVETLGFVVPSGVTWPLPLYEPRPPDSIAARRGGREDENRAPHPGRKPTGVFGHAGSRVVEELLASRGIELRTSIHAERFEDGLLHLVPGAQLAIERVIALPRLVGVAVEGIPHDGSGFVHTDAFGRIPTLEDVYAAGDGTGFPIKQGGVRLCKPTPQPRRSHRRPALRSSSRPSIPFARAPSDRLTTGIPSGRVGGGHMYSSVAADTPLWWPPAKISARYLAPYLAEHADLAFGVFGHRSTLAS